MRKLATVRQIESIRPIPGADLIEVAKIDGWEVVVKKGEFTAGSPCVYFEIDSFLPIRPEFEFLRKSSLRKQFGVEGFRLRTIKLKGQISQGLALTKEACNISSASIGEDVTQELGVKIWEAVGDEVTEAQPPSKRNGLIGFFYKILYKYLPFLVRKFDGTWPDFIPRTDEERIQNKTECFERWKRENLLFSVTEKLDGSSLTIYRKGRRFGCCSRNFSKKKDPTDRFWAPAIRLDLEKKMKSDPMFDNLALQGELCGPGIQKNKYRLNYYEYFVFRIFDIKERKFLPWYSVKDICVRLHVQTVPCIDFAKPITDFNTVADIVKFAEGESWVTNSGLAEREGLVFVTQREDTRISFKAISNNFLLKEEK